MNNEIKAPGGDPHSSAHAELLPVPSTSAVPATGDNPFTVFDNPEFGSVRVVKGQDGEPLFVAKDVAEALGYTWNGVARIAHVPEEWRGVTSIVTPYGVQDMLVLTEQGLYFFLNRSDKLKALPIQKWVAGEVMPSIRKRGLYVTTATAEVILNDPDVFIAVLTELKEERSARAEAEAIAHEAQFLAITAATQAEELKEKIEQDRSKVELANSITEAVNDIPLSLLTKFIRQAAGITLKQEGFYSFLQNEGYIHKTVNLENLPTQKSIDKGLMRLRETTCHYRSGKRISFSTGITGKGQMYFLELFKDLLKTGAEIITESGRKFKLVKKGA